jgi:UDP-glucuronate 4-epimerase
MAPMIFAKVIMEGTPIDVLNHGDMKRGFTYIDDIVEGAVRVSKKTPSADPTFDTANPGPNCSNVPYQLYNIGIH